MPAQDLRALDWNRDESGRRGLRIGATFLDETLRNGVQSPSVRHRSAAQKVALLHLLDRVGIATANLGTPGGGGAAP